MIPESESHNIFEIIFAIIRNILVVTAKNLVVLLPSQTGQGQMYSGSSLTHFEVALTTVY